LGFLPNSPVYPMDIWEFTAQEWKVYMHRKIHYAKIQTKGYIPGGFQMVGFRIRSHLEFQ
jgi:hypothetical protein